MELAPRRKPRAAATAAFTFPNLQPGHYQMTATFQGFQPVTLQDVIVETARSIDVVMQFQLSGVTESVQVEGRSVIESTSTTVSNTVSNEEIAKLPMAGRNLLNFALLVPGSATSAGSRDSEYNGLPGGAINITLDGVNNNSARFRSGGTSFFVFAPIRMGAIEEVTVSTAGLTAESGAEGAVQIQFATKRGTNTFHGQGFDQISDDRLNANSFVNAARGIPKTKLRQHEWGANTGGPIIKNKLFFFGNYEQIYSPSEATIERTILTAEAQQGIFRYTATDGSVRTVNLLDIAGAGGLPDVDRSVRRQSVPDRQRRAQPGRRRVVEPVPEHVSLHQSEPAELERVSDRRVWTIASVPISRCAACSTSSGAIWRAARNTRACRS